MNTLILTLAAIAIVVLLIKIILKAVKLVIAVTLLLMFSAMVYGHSLLHTPVQKVVTHKHHTK
jgi:hypothetical protein